MQRERITDDILVFTSDLYAQVTAGVVITRAGAIVIDTLLYPEETYELLNFVKNRLRLPVRYLINTHHHADHTMGTCFFDDVTIIAHTRCRSLLDTRGRESLKHIKETSPEMSEVELILPQMVFDDAMTLRFGGKTLKLWASPGHSMDSIACLVEDDMVLFAADTVMSLPYFVDGDYEALLQSLKRLVGQNYETIIQGHGEVILRGEADDKIKSDIAYLEKLQRAVQKALESKTPEQALSKITLQACGKSPILLNGAAQQLHQNNVRILAERDRMQNLLQTE